MNNNSSLTIDTFREEITKHNLQLAALIQDIQRCTGPLELLNELNVEGRGKISALKANIEKLASLIRKQDNVRDESNLRSEVDTYKEQLAASLAAFRKANVISACVIDKLAKENLLSTRKAQDENLRRRHDKRTLVNSSNKITDKLFSISRHLAETTQRSADTLGTLATSSDKVHGTKEELEYQQQMILQSGKLLGKYGRREVTDKVLLVLAFMFFLACVLYILQKRLL